MTRTTPTPETITLYVPFKLTKRGGRKLMIAPDGAEVAPRPRVDSALVKALARAHRWQRMLDSGEFQSVTEIAEAESINAGYVSRVLRLTLLAPRLAEAILEGTQPEGLSLKVVLDGFPIDWNAQEASFSL